MLKKAAVVAATAAGLALVGSPAFAAPHDGPHHTGQVGLLNVDDIHALNDIHALENVDVPVCITHIPVAVGLVAVPVDILNPTMVKDCVDGAAVSQSGNHHGG